MTVRAIAYAYVSREEATAGSDAGVAIAAQLDVVRLAVTARGWELASEAVDDRVRGSVPPQKRAALRRALKALDDGFADALVVARLDRISRRALTWAELLERSIEQRWAIVAVAEGFAVSADTPEVLPKMLATLARQERELRAARARKGMAAAKARGVRLGRPPQYPAGVRDFVVKMRENGSTLAQIAEHLDKHMETAQGGRWHPSTVERILNTARLEAEATAKARASTSEAIRKAMLKRPGRVVEVEGSEIDVLRGSMLEAIHIVENPGAEATIHIVPNPAERFPRREPPQQGEQPPPDDQTAGSDRDQSLEDAKQ